MKFVIGKSEGSDSYVALGDDDSFTGPDAATVIQRAISRVPRRGGEIFIEPGKYLIDSTIQVDRPLCLHGMGGDGTGTQTAMTRLHADEKLDGPIVLLDGENSPSDESYDGVWEGHMVGTSVTDLGLFGNGEKELNDCLKVTTQGKYELSDLYFERLAVRNAGRHGINMSEIGSQVILSGVMARHCARDGIRVSSGTRVWFDNCYAYECETGLHAGGQTKDISFVAPHVRGNSYSGISIESDSFQVIGGRSINNITNGITIGNRSTGVIFGAKVLNNGSAGVQIGKPGDTQTANVRLIGNFIGNVDTYERDGVRHFESPESESDKQADAEYSIERARELVRRFAEKQREEGIRDAVSSTTAFLLDRSRVGRDSDRQSTGVRIEEGVTDTQLLANTFEQHEDQHVRDRGTRTLINNFGTTDGHPAKSDTWRGKARTGMEVLDAESETIYKFAFGEWVPIGKKKDLIGESQ